MSPMVLQEKNSKLYVPERARIKEVEILTPLERRFLMELTERKTLGHMPGQFVMVSLLGVGEAAISIASPPDETNTFDLCIRNVGEVTKKIHELQVGDELFIRGPFGHGFDASILKKMEGKHLVFIAGGCGYFPLRSLINKALKEHEKYVKISILYGCKTPQDILHQNELQEIARMSGNIELMQTVDMGDLNWHGNVGLITTLIPKLEMEPEEVLAAIVGPPVMYKFVIKELLRRNVKKENIYISVERRMKCGVGKCGHCQIGGMYACQEGPVYCLADVENKLEVL